MVQFKGVCTVPIEGKASETVENYGGPQPSKLDQDDQDSEEEAHNSGLIY